MTTDKPAEKQYYKVKLTPMGYIDSPVGTHYLVPVADLEALQRRAKEADTAIEEVLKERDFAESTLNEMTSRILREPIDWPDHQAKWVEAIEAVVNRFPLADPAAVDAERKPPLPGSLWEHNETGERRFVRFVSTRDVIFSPIKDDRWMINVRVWHAWAANATCICEGKAT